MVMSDAQANLAAAALAIALVALLTTLTQLLQSSFTTAEGYRRCQGSVLGPWAKHTRLRWRFREFRFETRFTVPVITIRNHSPASDVWPKRVWGKDQSVREPQVHKRFMKLWIYDETVSWLLFLGAVENSSLVTLLGMVPNSHLIAVLRRMFDRREQFPDRTGLSHLARWEDQVNALFPPTSCSTVEITPRERSWDFVPSDVIRPLALSNVTDIGIIGRRLGMKWIEFRPSDGIMKAEGGGRVFTSTYVRSVGTILHYLNPGEQKDVGGNTSPRPPPGSPLYWDDGANVAISTMKTALLDEDGFGRRLYIPRPEADKMCFGILPGYAVLGVPDLHVANDEEALKTMRRLKCSSNAMARLKIVAEKNDHWTSGFPGELTWSPLVHMAHAFVPDLIAMAAPVIRFRDSQFIQVPAPALSHHGLTYEREGFKIFHHKLQQYIEGKEDVSPQIHWVLQRYEQLRDQFPEWEDEDAANLHGYFRPLELLEQVHDRWDDTTQYFKEWETRTKASYVMLLTCHVEHTAGWPHLPRYVTEEPREYFDLNAWFADGMYDYFEQLPNMVEYMRDRGVEDGALVEEAWFTLMFRAFCWHRLHRMVPGPTIPSVYYGSKMPVYLG
ncbi:MAG: hypothetical protein M1823_003118 [Watsoniomyces obsoletus]|nr:MAG: hypothetical protein M1823_003118 [Watsoniomyces obsoletus]